MNDFMVTLSPYKYLCESIKYIPLKGSESISPYYNSEISIEYLRPENFVPTQAYVMQPRIKEINEIAFKFFDDYNLDFFNLPGKCYVNQLSYDDRNTANFDVIPPVIEEDVNTGQLIIADGMHRVKAAKLFNRQLKVIVIRNVNKEYPYYAYPLKNGWDDVKVVEEKPKNPDQKKNYREPDNHKRLFRDFNSCFHNIQPARS